MSTELELIHSLPGRLRIRLWQIHRKQALAALVEHLLTEQDGVYEARANASAACITVVFDERRFSPYRWLSSLSWDRLRADSALHRTYEKPVAKNQALRRAVLKLEARLPPKAQFGASLFALSAIWLGAPAFLTRVALLAATVPILNRATLSAVDERKISADLLDGVSLLLLIGRGSFSPAGVMLSLIALGELMRDQVTASCQQLFADQLSLDAESAWLINGSRRVLVPVSQLHSNDRVAAYAGELISVHGTVYGGEGTVVPATPEMDFEPQTVRAGDKVGPGTLLTEGKLYIQSDQGETCPLPDLVSKRETRHWMQRTQLHKRALRRAHTATLPMLSAAALIFVITRDVHRAVAFVCFDFITGIKIAIPTAVLASMIKAGRRGIVMRNATALEKLAEVDTIIFARGGALTSLKPVVTNIHVCEGFSLEQVTRYAAAVVQRYNHLGACAIYSYAHLNKIPVPERAGSNFYNGLGVTAEVEGHSVLVGSTSLLRMQEIDLSGAKTFLDESQKRGDTRSCVAIDGKLAGVIAYRDPVRSEAKAVVTDLRAIGIKEIAVVSSGGQIAAESVAASVGITTVHYRTLPEEQGEIVRNYKQLGRKVAVIGYDSANTLALEQADVAISLETGADIARHRADVVLTSDDLSGLVEGIILAREGMSLARQNLFLTAVPNFCGLLLSCLGKGEFLAAALINNGSVIVGAANGLRPLLDPADEDPDIDQSPVSGAPAFA